MILNDVTNPSSTARGNACEGKSSAAVLLARETGFGRIGVRGRDIVFHADSRPNAVAEPLLPSVLTQQSIDIGHPGGRYLSHSSE